MEDRFYKSMKFKSLLNRTRFELLLYSLNLENTSLFLFPFIALTFFPLLCYVTMFLSAVLGCVILGVQTC
jgi:hypothetical protein